MELPESVAALGEQLRQAAEIAPDPALFADANVFAAERERIFARPFMAVDHATRLAADAHYILCDAATRSVIVTRDCEGRLHALRNVCIHAGYPVCDAEGGPTERLVCPYHGWEFALDGRLVEPALTRIDPSRLRLTGYPVCVRNGLILVDLSANSSAAEECADAAPDAGPTWLAAAKVTGRARYSTTWNWKFVRHFLRSSPHLFLDDTPDETIEFGPLSSMIVRSDRAVLLRVIPKFAEQTDFQAIEMAAGDPPVKSASAPGSDAVADALPRADPSLSWFGRDFADWYWSRMSVGS
jgi:nitrite reductase/ring-hydroxylating ferredoxin subunit